MKMIAALFAGLAMMCAGTQAATLEQMQRAGVLRLCAHPDAMPHSSRDARPAGWVIDVAQALAEQLSMRLERIWTPNFFAVRRATCDLHLASLAADDDPPPGDGVRALRHTAPLLAVQALLLQRADAPAMTQLTADGPRVAVPSGSWAQHQLQRAGVNVAVSHLNDDAIADAVLERKVDAGVVSSIGLGWFRTMHPQAALQADAQALRGQGLDFALALGLRQADAATVAVFDKALQTLRQQGRLQSIGAQYGLALGTAPAKPASP